MWQALIIQWVLKMQWTSGMQWRSTTTWWTSTWLIVVKTWQAIERWWTLGTWQVIAITWKALGCTNNTTSTKAPRMQQTFVTMCWTLAWLTTTTTQQTIWMWQTLKMHQTPRWLVVVAMGMWWTPRIPWTSIMRWTLKQ
jgi:hypothetical protein